VIRTAVIPAAGLGTRFWPATKSVPKELMPIFDTPALQYVMDEAIGAGIEHLVIVSNVEKVGLEQYLIPSADVVRRVAASGREELAERLGRIGTTVSTTVVYQDQPRGLGHAIGCARDAVGGEAFAVLLPDEIMGDSSLLMQLAVQQHSTGSSAVGLKRVAREEVPNYGCVSTVAEPDADGAVQVTGVVEKPGLDDAPSDIIIIGRYVLDGGVFDVLDGLESTVGGEIQLTDALHERARSGCLTGIVSDIERYDTGTPFGWLEAVIELTLKREEAGDKLRTWLEARFR
jgi:UTP--glucose-1-phosphate uridylyltransferase